mmetsp:Transcript_14765/g.40323  ORF Transcript_14765/g.40323 Transcript_14765/m.40323 type:complete len:203 (-) Transcript_14765:334-942(-)
MGGRRCRRSTSGAGTKGTYGERNFTGGTRTRCSRFPRCASNPRRRASTWCWRSSWTTRGARSTCNPTGISRATCAGSSRRTPRIPPPWSGPSTRLEKTISTKRSPRGTRTPLASPRRRKRTPSASRSFARGSTPAGRTRRQPRRTANSPETSPHTRGPRLFPRRREPSPPPTTRKRPIPARRSSSSTRWRTGTCAGVPASAR